MKFVRRLLALLLAGLSAAVAPAAAQSGGQFDASLTAVDAYRFPQIDAYLSVHDAAGQPVAGLPADAFSLFENGTPVPAVSVLEAEVGIQAVFVLDVNAAFKTRDAAGDSRLDYIRQALMGFLQRGLADADDLTLITPEGELVAHVGDAAPFADALNRYATEFVGAADPGALLSSGLNFASDVTPRPGMRRIMVVFSNGLSAAPPLADLVARARASQVQIHTVLVGPPEAAETVGAQNLRALSAPTGGQDVLLQSPASLEPLLQSVAGQRRQYRLSYRSRLNATGQHQLAAAVRAPAGAAFMTPEITFQLRVEPPLVSLLNPPAQIDLASVSGEYPLPVQVSFPDGHPRALRGAELLVDGEAVSRHEAAEVAALTWSLSGYTASVTRTLQVRVTDELGLNAESKPVEVFVSAPLAGLAAPAAATQAAERTPETGLWIAAALAGALLMAGLGAAWIWGRPLLAAAWAARPPAPPRTTAPVRALRKAPPETVRLKDTMPLKAPPAPTRRLHLPRVTMPRGRAARPAAAPILGRAYLEVVEAGSGGASQAPLELAAAALRIGRDPELAEAVFPDRSVSRLHARIAETGAGVYTIYDEGSTSGTWVNFTAVPPEAGCELKPGDLINLGRVQLRFRLRDLPEKPSASGRANGRSPGRPPAL